MNAAPAGSSLARPAPAESAVALALGVAFTAGLFLAIARLDRHAPAAPPADLLDLRTVSVVEPPPPPREVITREQAPLQDSLVGIESAPSDSPVQLAVTPPDLEALLPPPREAPPAVIQVGQLYPNLKPKLQVEAVGNHIFQMAEVDRVPQVLNRVTPRIPTAVRGGAPMLRVSLIFVVNADGSLGNIRVVTPSGNPEFDAIIMENIREWSFAPAIRRGVKVKCLLQQAVIIRWSGGSPFML